MGNISFKSTSPQKIVQDTSACISDRSFSQEHLDKINQLVSHGRVREAWNYYVELDTEWEYITDEWRSINICKNIPPENLINALCNYLQDEGVLKVLSVTLLRDCALKYENFRKRCLSDDVLWNCFRGFPDFIADICAVDSQFALKLITTERCDGTITDNFRFEIFRSAHHSLLIMIKENKFTVEKAQYLTNFLLKYSYPIKLKEYLLVKETLECINKQKDFSASNENNNESNDLFYASVLFNLVEGKLSLQGIYQNSVQTLHYLPNVIDSKWLFEVAQKITNSSDVDEELQAAILYLKLIPEEHPEFIEACTMLGNIYFDLERYAEAGAQFIKAIELSKNPRDEIIMASMALFLKTKDPNSNDWTFIRRDQEEAYKAQGSEVKTLSPADFQSIDLNRFKNLFVNLYN